MQALPHPSRAPVPSFAHYFQAPATQANTNRTIGKRIGFLKEALRFVQFSTNGKPVLSRLVCHHFCSLAAQAVSRNAHWREVRLHHITGIPTRDSYVFQRLLPVHILLLRYRQNCHKRSLLQISVQQNVAFERTATPLTMHVLELSRPDPSG